MARINNKWIRGALPALLIHLSIGSVYAWSLFVEPIANYIGTEQSQVQFAFSLAIFFLGMSAAFGGSIVEKDIHKSSLISCICFCSGLLLTALAVYIKSLLLIYIGYGCLMGIGLGIGYITPIKSLMLWFRQQKGLATGIAVCAFGFASAIASPIITWLTANITLPESFIVLSLIYFLPMIIAHLLIKKPDWYKETTTKTDFKAKNLLKSPHFILIWFIVFINITCGLALISTASPIMTEQVMTSEIIAIVISIMGIFNGAGRLIFSAISDKLRNRANIYKIILLISIAVSIITVILANTITIPVTLIVISACYGAGFSCLPSLLSDIFGMDNVSKIHGITLTAWGIAGLVGNQISGLIYSICNSYLPVFIVITVLYVIALVLSVALVKKS